MSAMLWVAVVVGLVGVGQGSLSFHDTAASLELFVGADRQTYFRVYVGKDQVLRSEGYTSKAGALNGVGSVVVNGMDGGNYRIMDRKDGRKYFNLKAQNHRVIATSSGSFATEAEAAEAAEVVVRGLRTLMLRSQEEYVTMGSVGAEGRAWFRVQRSRNGQYHFHLRLADGQRSVFAHSFRGEKEAREGVVEVFVVGNKKAGYEERVNAIGQHFFQLTRFGGEGQLAISNMYATEEERDEVADMVHAALRSLVQHVVATVVRQAPTAVPAEPAMCTTLETQLMNLVFEVADGKLTPRFMFEGPWLETAELVSAYVVQSAGFASLPVLSEEFKAHARTTFVSSSAYNATADGALDQHLREQNLFDMTGDQGSPRPRELVDLLNGATETMVYEYASPSAGTTVDVFAVARYEGCSRLYVVQWRYIWT